MYSVQTSVSDGSMSSISISIEYFAREDITLYSNLDTTPLTLGVDWKWDTDATITLLTNVPVPAGDSITIRRNTNKERAYNIYDGGAAFSRATLDENFKQMIYLAQEFTEGNGLTGVFFPLDMHGFRIINLGTPQNTGDAANKGYVDAQVSSEATVRAAADAEETAARIAGDNTERSARMLAIAAEAIARQNGDAALLAMLMGEEPIGSSMFSPISWHGQVIDTSVIIPPNKNAWSFGPTMEVAEGQSVEVSEGSFYTVADGSVITPTAQDNDYGEL